METSIENTKNDLVHLDSVVFKCINVIAIDFLWG